jgi:hypothetical protein
MSIFWFDMLTKTYRFLIFDGSDLAVELPPPVWNEKDPDHGMEERPADAGVLYGTRNFQGS